MNSFDRALQALENNDIDEKAMRALMVCMAADDLLAALEATLIPLMRLGDFIGNTDSGGASGLGAFDRCAIIGRVRDTIDKAKTEGREGEWSQ